MKFSAKGFTVVELLLGLVIFSVVSLTLYSVFFTGIRLSSRSKQYNQIYREANWALSILSEDLESALVYDFSQSYPDRKAFVGKENEISFIRAQETGLKVIRYYFQLPEQSQIHQVLVGDVSENNQTIISGDLTSERVGYLIREERDFIKALSDEEIQWEETEILSARVKEGSLQFFFANKAATSSDLSWEQAWDQLSLPKVVRVAMEFVPMDGAKQSLKIYRDIYIPTGSLSTEEVL